MTFWRNSQGAGTIVDGVTTCSALAQRQPCGVSESWFYPSGRSSPQGLRRTGRQQHRKPRRCGEDQHREPEPERQVPVSRRVVRLRTMRSGVFRGEDEGQALEQGQLPSRTAANHRTNNGTCAQRRSGIIISSTRQKGRSRLGLLRDKLKHEI